MKLGKGRTGAITNHWLELLVTCYNAVMLCCLQVARSVEYVQSGTVALQDAKMLQKKTRKWMCCAIILLLVTAAVIVVVVSGCDTVCMMFVMTLMQWVTARKWARDLPSHSSLPIEEFHGCRLGLDSLSLIVGLALHQ